MSSKPRIDRFIKALEQELGDSAVLPVTTDHDDPLERLGSLLEQYLAQTKQREKEAQRLQSITTRVSAGLTLEEMLEYIYDTFRDVIPYHRMGLALIGENGRMLRSHWAKSDQPVLLLGAGFTAPMEGSSLQTILETGRPRILNDLAEYLDRKPGSTSTRLIVEEGFRSSLTCPLIADGQPVGFLFFSNRTKAAYASGHIDFFFQIANQLSILLEKGRLVSELASQKKDLESVNQKLQQNDEARRAILAIAAHDLRAPLSYIRTSTEVLLAANDDEMAAETPGIISGISRQARHLLDLLDKLLDYSMIETGQMSLTPVAVDVSVWITEIVARQRAAAGTKQIQLEVSPVPAGQFVIDPLRMEQVLTNYISNAVKYSSLGSKVRVETSREEELWRVAVHDQGPGIRSEEIDRLFRPFQRGLALPTGGEKSTGLGLSIARSIVLAHGGEVGVNPNPQGGATFWFTVPI